MSCDMGEKSGKAAAKPASDATDLRAGSCVCVKKTQEVNMSEAERRIAEHQRAMRELIDNDPLFKDFMLVDVGQPGEWPRLVLVRKEHEGAGIQMPEPANE
jgi:hypothetical protein